MRRYNLRMPPRTRYQQGAIRFRDHKVIGEWRGEPAAPGAKRPHLSITLGARSKYPDSKALARRKALEDLQPHIQAYYRSLSGPQVTPSMTVGDFVEQVYLPAHRPGWAPNTLQSLTSQLNQHILKPLGSMQLTAIGKANIVERINELRAAGYSKRTIRIVKWMLGSIFEEAIDNDLVQRTPVRRLQLRGLPDGEETRPLTEDEVRLLMSATAGRDRLIWSIMLLCGLRVGEVCALRRNDVGPQLRVDQSYGRGFKAPKNNRTRWQPIPPGLRADLEAWLREQVGPEAQALLFTRPDGAPISEPWLYDHVLRPTKAATGIEDLQLRAARTTYATLLQGDVADVQELMGHADPEMTLKHYRKGIPERQVHAVEALEHRLTARPRLKVVGGKR